MSSSLRDVEFERILLVKPTALGDVVHAIPVLVELRRRYPKARIDWLVTPENAELVRAHPGLSSVVLFDRKAFRRGWRAWRGLIKLWRALRAPRYDLVIDLHGQLRSALFSLATGAPVRIGFDRPRRRGEAEGKRPARGWAGAREGAWLAYTHRIPISTLAVHAIDRYLWVGKLLGFEPRTPQMTLHLPAEAIPRAEMILERHDLSDQPFAVMAPATLWETKHWRAEGFGEVAKKLSEDGWGVLVAGGPGDRERAERIHAQCPAAINLAGQTDTATLAALIGRAGLCIANDSAAAHLAVAMGTPLVAIYGPTNPVTVGPYGRPEAIVRLELPCSPCNFRRLVQCPNGHACMQQLATSSVLERVAWAASHR